MFHSRIRQSAAWSSAIAALASPSGLNLRESNLEAHDLAITIPPRAAPSANQTPNNLTAPKDRTLRVALLEPPDIRHKNQDALFERLVRLSTMTGGTDTAIVFLLQDKPDSPESSIVAYMQLQSITSSDAQLRTTPILPLHSPSALCTLLQNHVHALSAGVTPAAMAAVHAALPRLLDLVAHCTSAAPVELLDRHTVYLLTDLVGSVRELAGASFDSDAMERVREGLKGEVSDEVVRSLWEFWWSEWAVE